MAREGWHRPEVDRDRVWRAYVDNFGTGHAMGILQENGQNSFDAYPEGMIPRNMKIVIKYDADKRTLSWRDFNTNGMAHCRECTWGERGDGLPCTNSDCPWGAFHNMGYSVKTGGDALGSRGMGKALQLLAGDRTFVKTTLPDGRFAASEWTKTDDWEWRLAPELAEVLSAPGTELVTVGINDAVHEALLSFDAVVLELEERWFRLLQEGATIEYILVKSGQMKRRLVPEPKWPDVDASQGMEKAKLSLSKVVITHQGERLGELRNFNLVLARTAFDEDDKRWGVAIVKNGKQTIMRFTEFPSEIPEQIRRKIYGWCDAICTEDEPFLRVAENATHSGYRADNTTYKAVKRQIREITKRFSEPFIRAGGERVTEREVAEADDLLAVLNDALKEIPDFQLFVREGPPPPPPPPTQRTYVYLSRIDFERRSYERGGAVPIKAVVKNPLPRETPVRVVFEHYDPTPVVVGSQEEVVILPPGTSDEPSTREAEWRCPLDTSLAPGLHWLQVSLRNLEKQPFVDSDGNPIRNRHMLYVEEEPPEIERKRTGHKEKENGTGGFRRFRWYKKPELAETYEAYIDVTQATVFVNLKGRRLANSIANAKNRKGYWPVVAELVGEKIVEQRLEARLSEKDDWKADDVRKLVESLESNRAKLVRLMIGKIEGIDRLGQRQTQPQVAADVRTS